MVYPAKVVKDGPRLGWVGWMAGSLKLSEEAKVKHARSDYTRIQDLAEVCRYIREKADAWRLEGNIDDSSMIYTVIAMLEARYGKLEFIDPIPVDEPVFVLRSKDLTAPQSALVGNMKITPGDAQNLVSAAFAYLGKIDRMAGQAMEMWFILMQNKDELESMVHSPLADALLEWKFGMDNEVR